MVSSVAHHLQTPLQAADPSILPLLHVSTHNTALLAQPSLCVPCVGRASSTLSERIKWGLQWLWGAGWGVQQELVACLLDWHLLEVARRGQPIPSQKFPDSRLCTSLNLHCWKISRSEYDWRTFFLSFKSLRFYDIVFHWRSSLKNEVEIPKEIASISSRA